MKARTKKTLSKAIDVERNYNFRPYPYTPREISPFSSEASKEILMAARADIPHVFYFYYPKSLLHFCLQSSIQRRALPVPIPKGYWDNLTSIKELCGLRGMDASRA